MTEMIDHVLPFIKERIETYEAPRPEKPLFIALNGIQGSGKTTLVRAIGDKLRSPPYSLSLAIISIDDFYLRHEDQLKLAAAHPNNPLIQHRGQPSTHDVALLRDVFRKLDLGETVQLPKYDKSSFNGQGDRVDPSEWETLNRSGQAKIQVVIFEGWCVGFTPLWEDSLREKWQQARTIMQKDPQAYRGRLALNKVEDLLLINQALSEYDRLTRFADALIHLDAEDTMYVYEWRLEQEASLRQSKGQGMTDEEVHEFVNGYYPSYELYTEDLRRGWMTQVLLDPGNHLRVVIDRNRKVSRTELVGG